MTLQDEHMALKYAIDPRWQDTLFLLASVLFSSLLTVCVTSQKTLVDVKVECLLDGARYNGFYS